MCCNDVVSFTICPIFCSEIKSKHRHHPLVWPLKAKIFEVHVVTTFWFLTYSPNAIEYPESFGAIPVWRTWRTTEKKSKHPPQLFLEHIHAPQDCVVFSPLWRFPQLHLIMVSAMICLAPLILTPILRTPSLSHPSHPTSHSPPTLVDFSVREFFQKFLTISTHSQWIRDATFKISALEKFATPKIPQYSYPPSPFLLPGVNFSKNIKFSTETFRTSHPIQFNALISLVSLPFSILNASPR